MTTILKIEVANLLTPEPRGGSAPIDIVLVPPRLREKLGIFQVLLQVHCRVLNKISLILSLITRPMPGLTGINYPKLGLR
jgi:hypothetical protein